METAERATGVDLGEPGAGAAVVAKLDRIDALVCNAGTTARAGVLELEREEWDSVIAVNLGATFELAQAAARRMVEQGGGSIVLLASLMSFVGGFNISAYSASKGGVAQLAKAMSNELAGRGVRVNAIAPGYIETDLTASMEDWRKQEVLPRIPRPLGHPGRGRRRDRVPALRRRALRDRRRDPGRRRLPGTLRRTPRRIVSLQPKEPMPLIRVELFDYRVTPEVSEKLIAGMTDALCDAVHPDLRDHTWVIVEGHNPKNWGVGGKPWPVGEMPPGPS